MGVEIEENVSSERMPGLQEQFQVVSRRRRGNRVPTGVHRLAKGSKSERQTEPEINVDRVIRLV